METLIPEIKTVYGDNKMIGPELQKFIAPLSISVSQAMQRINDNAGRILFLVNEEEKLCGCITDGDIRRFLLAGGKMESSVMAAANHQPKAAFTEEEAKALYHRKNYIVIPILNESGAVIDLYSGSGNETRVRTALNVPVVINAGGRGTRLDPFTRVLPKPLIPVGDLPIIEHIMKEYQRYSCNQFHIIVNYKRSLLKAYFAENERRYDIAWYDEETPLGTGGGLSLLRGKLDGTFFFTNCDNLLTANYERILEFHREHHNVITMVCAFKNFQLPYGIVEMGVNGRIENMKEKPLLSFLTNTGIYLVEPEVLDDMEDGVSIGFPEVVARQKDRGRSVAVFPVGESEWLDMGQLSELEKMRTKLYGE